MMRRVGHSLTLRLAGTASAAVNRNTSCRHLFSSTTLDLDAAGNHATTVHLDNDTDDDVDSMTEALLQSSSTAEDSSTTTTSSRFHHRHRVLAATVPPLHLRHMTPMEAKRTTSSTSDMDNRDEGDDDDIPTATTVGSRSRPVAGNDNSAHPSSVLGFYLQSHPVEDEPSVSHLLHDTPLVELLDKISAYCRSSSDNPRLVNAVDEAALFPVLVRRLQECNATQLLDVAELSMARSTLVRHGLLLRDLIRDRIGLLAGQLTPAEVLRSIVVMGIVVAGRRKRDLEFFQVLGRLFMLRINQYKDPGDLVRVMTAFSRAKIVPPPTFLDLIGRRLPVLCKTHPLEPLPAYRLLTNLFKMGHDQLPSFRFLADRICQHAEAQLRSERAVQRTAALLSSSTTPSMPQTLIHGGGSEPAVSQALRAERMTTSDSTTSAAAVSAGLTLNPQLAARRRFVSVTGLRPSQFTKLLLVLARCGAPHQQYLRPYAESLLVPSVAQLSPPVFSRLIRAIRIFRSPDVPLISAVMAHVARLGPAKVLIADLLEVIRILAAPDVPADIPNTDAFIGCCVGAFRNSSALRPTDMCTVTFELMRIQEKVEVPLESVELLVGVLDAFAQRMLHLLELRVLSLQHAELLIDACQRMHHPDATGAVEKLRLARLAVNQAEGSDEAYYATLDIDVRETFHMMLVVNHCNTFGAFRPIPGPMQADLRLSLTKINAVCILHAAHLFETAFPGTLMPALERILSRSLLAKLRAEGEEVVVLEPHIPAGAEEDTSGVAGQAGASTAPAAGKLAVVLRPNEPLRFTRESLKEFARLLLVTPLKGVRTHVALWRLLEAKAQKLGVAEVADLCRQECLRHQPQPSR